MFDFRPRPSDPGDLEYTQTSLLSREVTLYDNQILQTSVLGYFWVFLNEIPPFVQQFIEDLLWNSDY